jgi:hypothetical protein
MFLSYNTNLQFALLIDYYLNSVLIDGGHPVHAILARHYTASILSKQSEYNLGVATIVLDFIMLIQRYLDTYLFAGVIQFLVFLHIYIRHALETQIISHPLQRTGKCPMLFKFPIDLTFPFISCSLGHTYKIVYPASVMQA